jgi:hypothetical protein
LAKTALISFLFLFIYGQSPARQEITLPQDTVASSQDSLGFVYHKAWTFEEGYAEEYRAQPEYNYEESLREKNWFEQIKERIEAAWNRFWSQIWEGVEVSGFWKVFWQLAPYLLILVLMGLLVWLGMKYSGGGREDRRIGFTNLSADEVLLRSDNLQSLAEEALKNQDFRLALRYRYLLVLQQLIRRKLIVWKSSKTNYDYQKELRETPFFKPFTEVTRIYNFVWYGHFDLDEKAYGDLEREFNYLDQLP